jgi:hypothetical protein
MSAGGSRSEREQQAKREFDTEDKHSRYGPGDLWIVKPHRSGGFRLLNVYRDLEAVP